LSNRNKIFDDVRNNKNIAEEKISRVEGKGVRAGVSNRKRCTIAYYNFMGREGDGGGKYTMIGCHVGRGAGVHDPLLASRELHVLESGKKS
jgi:hypothetical protein